MPRHRKPDEIRQNSETVDVGTLPATDPPLEGPPPPLRTWLAPTKRSWERYWRSPAAEVVVPSLDLDLLERCWTLYDERERAQRELRKARVVEGSQGQMRPSGFYTVIARLDAEIRQLEDRIAKHMRSRLNLGMRVGGGADAGRGADSEDRPGDREDEREQAAVPDPRLYVMVGGAGRVPSA